ncbi:MAG: hypothetical protein U5K36_13045 [Roseovarius sp.]|nr:hypothetical protein [Roseovarius sp.]
MFSASAALADDDDCRSPMSQWQSQDAAVQHAARSRHRGAPPENRRRLLRDQGPRQRRQRGRTEARACDLRLAQARGGVP